MAAVGIAGLIAVTIATEGRWSQPNYGPSKGDALTGLWPFPSDALVTGHEVITLSPSLKFTTVGAAADSDVLSRAFVRYHRYIFASRSCDETGTAGRDTSGGDADDGLRSVIVEVESVAAYTYPTLETCESYLLNITRNSAVIHAESVPGALRALETFSQLTISLPDGGVVINSSTILITDRPRFPWRGIMIDSARHFLPVPVIKTMIDAMSFNKLNVRSPSPVFARICVTCDRRRSELALVPPSSA